MSELQMTTCSLYAHVDLQTSSAGRFPADRAFCIPQQSEPAPWCAAPNWLGCRPLWRRATFSTPDNQG